MIDESVGKYELQKLANQKQSYTEGMQKILAMGYEPLDFIHYFPAFCGELTIARYLTFYEAYKMVLGVSGHIAEIGMYKGAVSLFFAKLTQLFEPKSLTLVHGFDWFQGADVTDEEKYVAKGECEESYDRVIKLIEAQNLSNIVYVHNLDITKDLDQFFAENPYLRFKLIFCDIGIYEVVKNTLEYFWPRLTSGGIMLFDHFNHEVAPGETRAIIEYMPEVKMRNFPFGWMPTSYVIKP